MNTLGTETTTTMFWNATAVLITSLIGLAIAIIFVVAYVQIISPLPATPDGGRS